MQQPTCSNIRIRSTADAHKIFGAVQQGILHMVTRRLDADERLALRSGCIYAWEERGPHSELTGLGIERFTEGRRWSPSRVRDVRGVEACQKSSKLNISQLFYRNSFFTTRNTLRRRMQCTLGWSFFFWFLPRRWPPLMLKILSCQDFAGAPTTTRLGSTCQANVFGLGSNR